MPYRNINVTVRSGIRLTPFISRENVKITAAVKKSKITIMFLLFIRSATMPPIGDNRIVGINANAITVPYKADDPVRFNR